MAQEAKLKGTILDENKLPIEYATITLKDEQSVSSQLIGAKSKEGGVFSIDKIAYGKYTINISSIGFETRVLKNYNINTSDVNLGNVLLSSGKRNLKDVVIKGERASMELGIDKKTFHVDKNITAVGGTASDILRNVPSVNVDLDGNLSVRGKENVTLLVDGKPSAMFGNDAATALATIPASSIESVEVITNPSSKYEAQGMNGIVNIILKKDRKAGYNAMINAGIAAPFRLNGGFNINTNVKKWNFFMNANARTSKTWEETTLRRDNYDNDLTYESYAKNDRRPLSGFANAGAEYSFDKNNKITLSQSIYTAYMKGDSKTSIVNGENYTTQYIRQQRNNKYIGNPLFATTNLQYKHIFKDPKEDINFELNYSTGRYIRESNFETSLYDSSDHFTTSYKQVNPVRGTNWNGTFVVDYTKPIGKKARIDIGERSYYMSFTSKNNPTIQYLNQAEIPETILKNNFEYTQQVHGVYANYANQFNKTGIQLGLRGEYFNYEGIVHQYNARAKSSYMNVFPTLFVSQKLDSKQDLNINYSRRVNRPNFFQLIPFVDVSNPQDTSVGNPNLHPEFINATELTYTYQYGNANTFMGSVYYQYTDNLIQRYRRFNDDGTTFSQNRNLAKGQTYGLELTNKMSILSWWDATLNINVFRNKINGQNIDASLNQNGFGGFGKLTTNMKFTKDFSGQLTANYFAPTVVSQGEVKDYGNIDLALKKSFYKGLVNVTINANDILNSIQNQTIYNLYPYYNQSVLRKNQTRSIGLNVQIRLASKSQNEMSNTTPRKQSNKKDKASETKSRDENLKKDDGGDDNGGGPGGGSNNERK